MFETLFEIQLHHGQCVGVRLPELSDLSIGSLSAELSSEEIRLAETLKPLRQRTFIGGRIALRRALKKSVAIEESMLPDDRGAPMLPTGWTGSVSHKNDVAVALVSEQTVGKLGVDIESMGPSKQQIEQMVLRPEEIEELGQLANISSKQEVLLRFSLKESVYKSLDPYVKRYVGFKEVAVSPQPNGVAQIRFYLPENEGPFQTDLSWIQQGAFFLTTARTVPMNG